MNNFKDKLAVVTGAGTGMGRELAKQLASEGCHLAICDVIPENMAETEKLCEALAPAGTLITSHTCDVSDESQVLAFCDAVKHQHKTRHINLLFNNAGIGGGGSFIQDDRAEWDKTFGVSWFGVYYCTRAFMPLLLAGTEGHIVNLSSVNGFWACMGPVPQTAYSSAKFAIKGFSEALVVDLRINAPHVKVSVVMPGHIGTSIAENTRKLHGHPMPADLGIDDLNIARERMGRMGIPTDDVSDEEKRRRFRMLEDQQARIVGEINANFLGETLEILFEEKVKGRWKGRTPNMKLVFVESENDLSGHILPVQITWTGPYSMQGRLLPEHSGQALNLENIHLSN